MVSKEGGVVDPEKIKAIMEWTTPMNVTKGRYFMELDGYYKKFIHDFQILGIQS